MEVFTYIFGLIMGAAIGIAWERRQKTEDGEFPATCGIVDTPEKFKEAMEGHEEIMPATGGSGESKKDTMRAAERVDRYIRLAELTENPDEKNVFILKAKIILDQQSPSMNIVINTAGFSPEEIKEAIKNNKQKLYGRQYSTR